MRTVIAHQIIRRSSLLLASTLFCVVGCGGAVAKIARTAPPTLTVRDERRCHFDRSHGAIFGTLLDRKTHQVLAEVTVLATSPALVAAGLQPAISISNASGVFAFSDLPPGRYDLTFYYDRSTEHDSLDVEANTVWPYHHWFTKAPRGDTEYLAQWRKPRIELPHQLSQFRSGYSSLDVDYDLDDCNSWHNTCVNYPNTFVDDISFSSNCALGHFPCAPAIARTDYPTFGTSAIVRSNPFASLRQR